MLIMGLVKLKSMLFVLVHFNSLQTISPKTNKRYLLQTRKSQQQSKITRTHTIKKKPFKKYYGKSSS
jgi:hypothetical protein